MGPPPLSTRLIAAFSRRRLVAGAAVALFVIGGSVAAQAASSSGATAASGMLTVDGTDYRFAPSTCLITGGQFVVAGSGIDGDEQFWVAASSAEIDLAVGTNSEVAEPSEDQMWLVSDETPSWTAAGNVVSAEASMSDPRRADAPASTGVLEFDCGTDGPT